MDADSTCNSFFVLQVVAISVLYKTVINIALLIGIFRRFIFEFFWNKDS